MSRKELFRKMRKSKFFVIGGTVMLLLVVLCVLSPLYIVHDPYTSDLSKRLLAPEYFSKGWSGHILGTDAQGRDILTRLLIGGRYSLFISVCTVACTAVVGVTLGIIAGYFGGWVDNLIMRIADIQLSFPSILIAMFLMSVLGRGIGNVLIALMLVGWVKFARTVRGETLSIRKMEYVDAAHVIGYHSGRIIFKHILPNVTTSLIVLATMQVGSFILIEATLSFLGLGVPVTEPSLGMLCSDGFKVMFGGLWWVSVFPGLYIVLIVFAVNLLGDFLRDELNPKLK